MLECDYYADPERYEAEVSFLAQDVHWYRQRALQAGGPVLVLGCGTGRLVFPLAAAGLEVTGLDIHPAMLSRARTRALQLPAALSRRIELLQADMSDFELPRRFATVLAPLNCLLHLHHDRQLLSCFGCVRRHLLAGGRFLFDVTRPVPELLQQYGDEKGVPVRSIKVGGHRYLQRERHRFDSASGISETVFTYQSESPGVPSFRCRLRLRLYEPEQIGALLLRAGLQPLEVTGGFDDQRAPDETATLVVCAGVATGSRAI